MAADGIADELIESGFVGDVTDGSIGLDMQWSGHDSEDVVDWHLTMRACLLVRC